VCFKKLYPLRRFKRSKGKDSSLDADFLKITSIKKHQEESNFKRSLKLSGSVVRREKAFLSAFFSPVVQLLLVECQLRNEKILEYHLTMKSTENVISGGGEFFEKKYHGKCRFSLDSQHSLMTL
jgi:hypothetical protein